MTRLKSSMNVSSLQESLTVNWEDNTGCASRLSSINLRLWPDGLKTRAIDEADSSNTSDIIEPITYDSIKKSRCLVQLPHINENYFALTLTPYRSQDRESYNAYCRYEIGWKKLDKCRKYVLEMETQYSSEVTGPQSSHIFFTSDDKPDGGLDFFNS